MKRHGPWRTLGLDPTEDRAAVRRAYADKLRALDPDKDIEGFARLRQARDHALILAKTLATAQANVGGGLADDEVDESWDDDFLDDEFWDDDDFGTADLVPGGRFPGGPDGEPAPPEGEPAEPTPPQVLVGILFPNGATSEEALSTEEWEPARQALAAIVAQAEASSIDEHAAIEGWLAHHLASAWPRSAWLLEPAAEAFGWMDESGKLSERPAIRFLNLRLRGMRFAAKVEEPRHPLHRAWAELRKPGPRNRFSLRSVLFVGADDIRRLLAGIRQRYPEVESHLDPQRVASWESAIEPSPWRPWKIVLRMVIALYVIALAYGAIMGPDDESRAPEVTVHGAEQLDGLVTELFGARLSDATLGAEAPFFKPIVEGLSAGRSTLMPGADAILLQRLRWMTLAVARKANFEELVAIREVELDLLRAARERGAADCARYGRDDMFPVDLEVDEDLRAKERALAARLLHAGRFRVYPPPFSTKFNIPPEIVAAVMTRSGLSRDAFSLAAHQKGRDADICAYNIAMLEVMLRRPGEVPAELLRLF